MACPYEEAPHALLCTEGPSNLFTPLCSHLQDAAARRDDTLSLALAVQGGTLPRQPLDLTLVVDRSGSMWAEGRMDYTKRGLNQLVDQLERGDRVDVVMFDDYVCSPVQNFVVGRDDPAILTQAVQRIEPRGGTDLDAGLREALRARERDVRWTG